MKIQELYQLFLSTTGVSTDSRNCLPRTIFFALKGERFDGNDCINQALEGGAAYAVCDREAISATDRIIKVKDALQALQQLANYHRRKMKAKVIGITGTNGKTTTKELTAVALSTQYHTLYTQGNLNNHIGVPLTLLRLEPQHEFAVIEMGANHRGEIATLCRLAEPDFGLITNVGKAHLEGFGSPEGVIRAKTELYDYLRENWGRVFANLDNTLLKDFYPFLSITGYSATPDRRALVYGEAENTGTSLSLTWHKGKEHHHLTTNLAGSYNLENVLAAVCIAAYFGIDSKNINQSIGEYIPKNNRSQNKKTEHNQLIIDAYNANPGSMRAALENFSGLDAPKKMLILGGMKELGDYSRDEHGKMLQFILGHPADEVYLVGKEFAELDSIPDTWKTFADTESLASFLETSNPTGFTVLIKGSRENRLESVVDLL